MTTHTDPHKGLHSEQGARGEHPGRSRNPLIKVRDLAWLEFEKPDLVRAEAFARRSGSARCCTPRTSFSCGERMPAHPA